MATWTAQRVAHHGILTLHDDVSQVFPLFRFDQEDRWADSWAYHPVYPEDGRAEANAVFMTDAHDHAQTSAIWVVIRYEPQKAEVAYLRVEPGVKVGCVTIACEKAGKAGSA